MELTMELNSVQNFYVGKTIFITGGSGFMGKVMIEKLLYSCSDVKEVIILMRPKRGKSASDRVEDFVNVPAFGRIMKEKPEMMKKISPVFGDVCAVNLGLNDEQLKKVVTSAEIMLHMAASLKLEATLKPNILTNLTATKNALDLAMQMKKLVQFVHLSTAFCCEDQDVLQEKVYEFHHKPADLIKCAEWMSEEAMMAMQKEILGTQPNTYTYTKRLAEILVRDHYGKLPVCIVRPSIVSPAFQEPLPGWVDSLNGPPGILLAAGKGVLRSMLMNPNSTIEAIPVDTCINGIIVMVKHLATNERSDEIPVYNMTIHDSRKITNGKMFKYAKELGQLYPCYGGLWYPDGDITQNVLVHRLKVFFFQLLPAYLIDFLFFCCGQKRFMVYIQKRIAVGMEVLQFFTMREWNFRSDNFQRLLKFVTPAEDEMFKFDSEKTGDEYEYLKNSLLGARQYCVKDPLSTLPKARLQLKIQYVVHVFCKIVFWYFTIGAIIKLTGLQEPVNDIIGKIRRNNSTIEA